MVLQGCRVCSVTGHACASSMAYLVPTQRLPPLPGAQTSQDGSAISELLPLVGRVGRPETPPGTQPLPQARSAPSLVREEGPPEQGDSSLQWQVPQGWLCRAWGRSLHPFGSPLLRICGRGGD